MKLKDKYHINDNTWMKLKQTFILIAFGTPFIMAGFSFIIWAIVDGFSWLFITILPWMIIYLYSLITFNKFFTHSKHTLFISFLTIFLIPYFFAAAGSACIFRLFDCIGLIILGTFLTLTSIYVCIKHYKYCNEIWKMHKFKNEEVILDKNNGRYDFVNNFTMDENDIKKNGKDLNPSIMGIIYLSSPIGVGFGIIFSKSGYYSVLFAVMSILSITAYLGFLKVFVISFYSYRKLAYYEKQIGKPIINGLIE